MKVYLHSIFSLQQVIVSRTPCPLYSYHTFYRTADLKPELDFIQWRRTPLGMKPQFSFQPAHSLLPISRSYLVYNFKQIQSHSIARNLLHSFLHYIILSLKIMASIFRSAYQKNVPKYDVCNHYHKGIFLFSLHQHNFYTHLDTHYIFLITFAAL